MNSVQFTDTEKSLAETLRSVSSSIREERITLRQLLELIGEQGMLMVCMFLCIPNLLPMNIPGVSTVFGLVILLVGLGVMLNRVPWLPRQLMERSFQREQLLPALEKGAEIFARIDNVIRPRMLVLTHGATVNRLNGILLIFGAMLLMLPLSIIPFSNALPALAILLLAAGMLQRDGLFVLGGYLALIATLVYFGALVVGAVLAGQGISQILGFMPMVGLL
jgi:hypothetical protein